MSRGRILAAEEAEETQAPFSIRRAVTMRDATDDSEWNGEIKILAEADGFITAYEYREDQRELTFKTQRGLARSEVSRDVIKVALSFIEFGQIDLRYLLVSRFQ